MNTQDLKILATDFMSHPLSRGISDCERIGEALFDAATEIEQLRLAEEGAKEAFGHVVQQKRDLEAECKRLRGLLDGAHEIIRRKTANAPHEGTGGFSPGPLDAVVGRQTNGGNDGNLG